MKARVVREYTSTPSAFSAQMTGARRANPTGPGAFRAMNLFQMDNPSTAPSLPAIYEIMTPLGSYVGQTKNLRKRLRGHLASARKAQHHNFRLQKALEVASSCQARVLEEPNRVKPDWLAVWLFRREAYWIQMRKPCLNIAPPEMHSLDYANHFNMLRSVRETRTLALGNVDRARRTAVVAAKSFAQGELVLRSLIRRSEVWRETHEKASAWIVRVSAFLIAPAGMYDAATNNAGTILADSILFHLGFGLIAWLPMSVLGGSIFDRLHKEPQEFVAARTEMHALKSQTENAALEVEQAIAELNELDQRISVLENEAEGFGLIQMSEPSTARQLFTR